MTRSVALLAVLAVALLTALSSIFIVDERQKALVLQFGRVVDVKEDRAATPGSAPVDSTNSVCHIHEFELASVSIQAVGTIHR